MIKQSSIDALLDSADILDVVSHYIQVRRSGSSYVCVCPFHDDTNPSMSINQNKQFYHCFACGAGGNAIKFVKDYEKLDFKDAVERLADIVGFSLEYDNAKTTYTKNHSLDVLHQAYSAQLPSQIDALEYLRSRGISANDIAHFELGYAPHSAYTLRVLQNNNISPKDALNYGAIKQNDGGYYASFINRITFTIRNDRGKIVGFGGRTLSSADNIAKYVNSPESAVFKKSHLLYLYDKAKDAIYKSSTIIICEGYMDAIALHKAGFLNAVAVLGVALTPYHLPLIKRPNARVILCFDSDDAGRKASFKSAQLLSQHGISGSVIRLSGAKDPSDILNQSGAKELAKQLNGGVDLGQFCIDYILDEQDLSDPIAMQNAVAKARAYTKSLGDFAASKYDEYIAKRFGVQTSALKTHMQKPNKRNFNQNQQSKIIKDYSELGVVLFLYENRDYIKVFNMICSVEFFANKQLLTQVLEGKDTQSNQIREMLLNDKMIPINTYGGFLAQVCFINLRYFKLRFEPSQNLMEKGYKINIFELLSKQIPTNIEQNLAKILILYINKVLNTFDITALKELFEKATLILNNKGNL